MSEPTTAAGRALMISLAAFPQGPGSALFGQECRNLIAATEREAWDAALDAALPAIADVKREAEDRVLAVIRSAFPACDVDEIQARLRER